MVWIPACTRMTTFYESIMSIIKKIIMIPVITIQGVVIGILLNFSWHYFLAEIIGWKDAAPDWYFDIQNMVFMFIFLLGLIGWISINLILSRKSMTLSPRELGADLHRKLRSNLPS